MATRNTTPSGTTLPERSGRGDLFYKLGDNAGMYYCTASGEWALLADSTGGFDLTGPTTNDSLVVDPDFADPEGPWVLGAGWAYDSDTVVHTPGDTDPVSQDVAPEVGKLYFAALVQSAGTDGLVNFEVGGLTSDDIIQIAGSDDATDGASLFVAQTTDPLELVPDTDYDGTIDYAAFSEVSDLLDVSMDGDHPLFGDITSYHVTVRGNGMLRVTDDSLAADPTSKRFDASSAAAFDGDVKVRGDVTAGGYNSSDGTAGITTTVTTASLVGKTITIKDGLIVGFA